MADLDFALDGLYAAGWWPQDGVDCRQNPDQRWYPSPETILNAFAQQNINLTISMPLCGHPVAVRWHTARSGTQSVMARNQAEALILAYTHAFSLGLGGCSMRDAKQQAVSEYA